MKIAYFDCTAGAAGDMITAAMLDTGMDLELLKEKLTSLGLENLTIRTEKTTRGGLSALRFIPQFPAEHHHRRLSDINSIIDNSDIGHDPKETAKAIFNRLARAEAKVHDLPVEKVHFHEVGALDSITDIVSAAIGYHGLGIEKLYCSPLAIGGGTIKTAHGRMPVPAPATAELLKNVPVTGGPIDKELLTPTAAAILVTLVDSFGPLPQMKISAIGCGAGSMDPKETANITRLFLGTAEKTDQTDADSVYLLETNIDDSTGEHIGQAMQILLEAGALDVFTTPIGMKNNRPAVKLSVICQTGDFEKMRNIIFTQGLTFGIRFSLMNRSKLQREFTKADTAYGAVTLKLGKLDGKIVNIKPEFSDCAILAKKHDTTAAEVARAAIATFKKTSPEA